MDKSIVISGPYYQFSNPFGDRVTCQRDVWYVSRSLTKKELNSKKISPIKKILKRVSLGVIVKPRNQKRYVIDQIYPLKEYKTLSGAVNYLVKNEGELVFCT